MELFAKFNQLETKQKVTLLVTVLIGIFAIYLGYDTFFGGTSAPVATPVPAVASKPAVVANVSAPNPASVGSPSAAGAANNNANGGGSADGSATPPGYTIPAAAKPTPAQLAVMAQSQGMQQQYMNLVNAYQMAQIEQKLADANSKIAESKLSTAKALVSTQKYVAELPSAAGLNMASDNNAAPPQVVYVGQQAGQWLAMLNIDGNYIQVNVGTHLQDGSVVTAISDKGVIMDKDGEPAYLPMAKSMQ